MSSKPEQKLVTDSSCVARQSVSESGWSVFARHVNAVARLVEEGHTKVPTHQYAACGQASSGPPSQRGSSCYATPPDDWLAEHS